MDERVGGNQRPCPHCDGTMIYMPKILIPESAGRAANDDGSTPEPFYSSGWQCTRDSEHIVWDGPVGSICVPVVCQTCNEGINAWVLPDPEIGPVKWHCPKCNALHEQNLGGKGRDVGLLDDLPFRY
jgi:hypothetical protein